MERILYVTVVITCLNIVTSNFLPNFETKSVKLEVYYETLCPASVDFFVNQLKPAVEQLGPLLDVVLVPYGHARTYHQRRRIRFMCQHGSAECHRNAIHACAIHTIGDSTKSALFTSCLMEYSRFNDENAVLNWCAFKYKVSLEPLRRCTNSTLSSILLKQNGQKTQLLRPRYIPYLLIDGSIEKQNMAVGDLLGTACGLIRPRPTSCSKTQRR